MHLAMMSQNRNQITIIIVVPLAHSAQWDCHQMVGVLETMIATRIIDGRNGSWGGMGDGPALISSFFVTSTTAKCPFPMAR
jgi:hypothetical protein